MVNHGHVTVNGGRVDIASYQVQVGDVVRVKNRAKSLDLVRGALADGNPNVPDFLSVTGTESIPEGLIGRLPQAEDVSLPIQTQLIVELCSR